jgi:hypothetical protein
MGSGDPTETGKLINTITQNIPPERRLEWIGFLMYAVRADVIPHGATRAIIQELLDAAHRVAQRQDDAELAKLKALQKQSAQAEAEAARIQAETAAAERNPLGFLALTGSGAALGAGIAKGAAFGGAAGGPVGALVGGGVAGIVGMFAFL